MGAKANAEDWLLSGENIGKYLCLNETSLSIGKLYTILINKNAQGKKGAIVAMVKGTKASNVIHILGKIPLEKRNMVAEVSLIWQVV